jgi:hypothetical protein
MGRPDRLRRPIAAALLPPAMVPARTGYLEGRIGSLTTDASPTSIFAHHPIMDKSADHFDAGQWRFHVVATDRVATIWQKWLSRRDRRGRFPKSRFSALLQRHPLPAARIVHRYTLASKALP